jgi:rhamnosyltransferase subunit B
VRVLLTTIGSFGDLNPYIGLSLALKRRGHVPVLAVAHAYRPHVEAAGLECRPVGPHGDPWDRALVERIMHPLRGAEFLVRDLLMPAVGQAYDDLFAATADVDAIVSHPLTFAAPLVAEKRGLPWAGAVLAPMNFFSLDDPPQVVASPVVSAIHRHWPGVMRWGIPLGKVVTRSWGEPVQELRRKLGLPRGGHPVYEGQFSPHLNLALFSRVLAEPQPDWPPKTVVTGAVPYDAVHGGLPDGLGKFLESGPPPVVFTLGSAAVSHRRAASFYEASAAVAIALRLRAVLLVGQSGGRSSNGEDAPPDNRPATKSPDVFVADWAPHSELFPLAAAVVHQGGAGTLHSALAAGRPMIVVPFAHDQPDNASRVERLGVARTMYPQQYTADRVHGVLAALLGDRAVKKAAVEVGAKVRGERGGDNAVDALEALAGTNPSSRSAISR